MRVNQVKGILHKKFSSWLERKGRINEREWECYMNEDMSVTIATKLANITVML